MGIFETLFNTCMDLILGRAESRTHYVKYTGNRRVAALVMLDGVVTLGESHEDLVMTLR